MDVFQQLAGGGVRFDKKRFASDMAVFQPKQKHAAAGGALYADDGARGGIATATLPQELDFFGDSNRGASSSKNVLHAQLQKKEARDGKNPQAEAATAPTTKSGLTAFFKEHKIKQTGTDPPRPIASWRDMTERYDIDGRLLKNLGDFGWPQPTAVQMGAIPSLLESRDTLVGAPTGSGKTLAYLLPLLDKLHAPKKEGFRAVVVCPTMELATQIHQQLEKLGAGRKWRFCTLTRSTEGAMRQDPQSRKKYDILITTPLRLVHAIEQQQIELGNVQFLILDEADRLLEEGFLDQTDSILAACTHSALRKALFSATMPASIEELAKTFMVDEVRILVGTKDAAVESVAQELLYVSSEDGKLLGLRNLIRQGQFKPPVMLFVQSIERAQDLYKELVYDDLHVDVIHSDRPKAQREGVVEAFKRGEVWVLICTEVLARGIDFKGVEVVINYDFPQTRESYIHRIGRTGRAGRRGKAITFFTRDDAAYLRSVVNVMRQSGCDVPQWMLDLKAPNQKQKKKLKRKAPERQDIKVAAGSTVGRKEANRQKDMIEASKRRKVSNAKGDTAASPEEASAGARIAAAS